MWQLNELNRKVCKEIHKKKKDVLNLHVKKQSIMNAAKIQEVLYIIDS